jgi:ribosome-binding factor A
MKKPPSQRQLRVAEEIKKLLAKTLIENNLFIQGLKAPYLMITEVQIAPDFGYTDIYMRAMPPVNTDEQVALLNEHKGAFRKKIGQNVRLRITPEVRFFPDTRFEQDAHIESILNSPRVKADLDKYKE